MRASLESSISFLVVAINRSLTSLILSVHFSGATGDNFWVKNTQPRDEMVRRRANDSRNATNDKTRPNDARN